ncbi:MAG: hypothetical protein IPI24_10060 [Ignavibacteria bacterium]|nr:hypothetical protein [Ignavibacteria bacterium]MBK6417993.1 hypothetical protein [Ignavibacteria bacterium]MBK6761013.1 hypothetical protein [Ignavibacteria bacterium]MBK7411491.1 hypothetical protein [Ignavibacteria bacterium]MBK7577760.1 hypothetical protein [Ignavibacteria bacterium]
MKRTLQSQYIAALEMCREIITVCSDDGWNDSSEVQPVWHVMYHALAWTNYYLYPDTTSTVFWSGVRSGAHVILPIPANQADPASLIAPYTKAELQDFITYVLEIVQPRVEEDDLEAPSGFPWLPCARLELHMYSIRHLQHHVGQLCGRLRTRYDVGVTWVGRGIR